MNTTKRPRCLQINKLPIPKEIESKMRLWRRGFVAMPEEYIKWHYDLAKVKLEEYKEELGIRVHRVEVVSDGWMDGMAVMRAVIETKRGNLRDLRWCDSNQNFMRKYESGGQGAIFTEDME